MGSIDGVDCAFAVCTGGSDTTCFDMSLDIVVSWLLIQGGATCTRENSAWDTLLCDPWRFTRDLLSVLPTSSPEIVSVDLLGTGFGDTISVSGMAWNK